MGFLCRVFVFLPVKACLVSHISILHNKVTFCGCQQLIERPNARLYNARLLIACQRVCRRISCWPDGYTTVTQARGSFNLTRGSIMLPPRNRASWLGCSLAIIIPLIKCARSDWLRKDLWKHVSGPGAMIFRIRTGNLVPPKTSRIKLEGALAIAKRRF